MAFHIYNQDVLKKPIDAVLFDLDDTLYPYLPSHQKALEAVKNKTYQLLGVHGQDFEAAFQQARIEIKNILPGVASSHSRLLYFQRMLEILGMKTQIIIALDLEQTYWRTFLSAAELFEGVIEFLSDLRAAGILTAIVTDLTAQIQFRKIIYFGLEDYFDFIITSEEAGANKPNSKIFNLAVDKLKVKSENIWMIGEHPELDIKGAKDALNCSTFQKLNAIGEKLKISSSADVDFESFFDLRSIFTDYEVINASK